MFALCILLKSTGVSLGFHSFVLQRFSLWLDVTPGDLVEVSGCLWAERKRRQPLTAAVYPVCRGDAARTRIAG